MRIVLVSLLLWLWVSSCSQETPVRLLGQVDCERSACEINSEVMLVAFDMPEVIEPFQPFDVSVSLDTNLKPESVRLNFMMLGMDMGRNVYSLIPDNQLKTWSGDALILPVCVTGRSDWRAEVMITADGVEYETWFDFEVN